MSAYYCDRCDADHLGRCPHCDDEGSNEGRYCDCPLGQEQLQAEHDSYSWMAHYARQANAYAREGDQVSAEMIRKTVCS